MFSVDILEIIESAGSDIELMKKKITEHGWIIKTKLTRTKQKHEHFIESWECCIRDDKYMGVGLGKVELVAMVNAMIGLTIHSGINIYQTDPEDMMQAIRENFWRIIGPISTKIRNRKEVIV